MEAATERVPVVNVLFIPFSAVPPLVQAPGGSTLPLPISTCSMRDFLGACGGAVIIAGSKKGSEALFSRDVITAPA